MKNIFVLFILLLTAALTTVSQNIPSNGQSRSDALIASSNPDNSAITVPNAFSPNGDGINDYFRIIGIEKYPDARLFVYTASNRKVYEKDHYGNIDFWGSEVEALWNGTNNIKGAGMQLPNGTYVYILDLANGNQKLIKLGTVFIKR
jgi:gliding motility-associated-like protein